MMNPDEEPLFAVQPFLQPDPIVEIAYRQLDVAIDGSPSEVKELGDLTALPRPWMVESCSEPALRLAVWRWYERVVAWLNHEYAWQPQHVIPGCWRTCGGGQA